MYNQINSYRKKYTLGGTESARYLDSTRNKNRPAFRTALVPRGIGTVQASGGTGNIGNTGIERKII